MTNEKLTPELMKKAEAAKSPEELLSIAKENGIEDFTEENAKAYFAQLHKSGELSDDELDNVAGGGCHYKDGRLVTTMSNRCKGWELNTKWNMTSRSCYTCKYYTYEHGLWLCNNPINIRKKRR